MYINVLQLFNCEKIIDTPTRISNNGSTVIDHIFCNVKEDIFSDWNNLNQCSFSLVLYTEKF